YRSGSTPGARSATEPCRSAADTSRDHQDLVLQSHLYDRMGETSEMDAGRKVSHATAEEIPHQSASALSLRAGLAYLGGVGGGGWRQTRPTLRARRAAATGAAVSDGAAQPHRAQEWVAVGGASWRGDTGWDAAPAQHGALGRRRGARRPGGLRPGAPWRSCGGPCPR